MEKAGIHAAAFNGHLPPMAVQQMKTKFKDLHLDGLKFFATGMCLHLPQMTEYLRHIFKISPSIRGGYSTLGGYSVIYGTSTPEDSERVANGTLFVCL